MAELIFALTVLAAILCAWDGSGLSVYAQNYEKTRSQVRSNRVTASDGRRLFASICAGCHGLDGRGGEKGPNIVTRSEILRRSDAEILATLRHGVPTAGMPAFLSLGTANLQALTAHLRHLQGLDGNLSVSADSAGGKELFFKKGSCGDCHMINGSGGFLGSDLSVYGAVTPLADIREQIKNHDRSPRVRNIAVSTRIGETLTGVVRNEDNFSLQMQTPDGNFHFLDKTEIVSVQYIQPAAAPGNHERPLLNVELDALTKYLVSVARVSKSAEELQPRRKHGEEDD